jgi:putative flippase GtrA
MTYALVGVLSNLAGYFVYLLLTWFRLDPKIAMTIVYITGAAVGYLGNKRWTFDSKRADIASVAKYTIAHLAGYSLNFGILYLFVDRLGYEHQWVQAVAILVVALFLFTVFKTMVFTGSQVTGPARFE